MKEKLLSIVFISIAMGICELVIPKYSGIEKYIRILGSLCIVCIIATSFVNAINNIDKNFFDELKEELIDFEDMNNDEYEAILQNYLNEFSESELKSKIKEILKEIFDIENDESEIVVFTNVSKDGLELKKIQILLSGKSIFKNPYTIEDYFNKLLSCECEVLIKQK